MENLFLSHQGASARLLHFVMMRMVKVVGITTGSGYTIRAFTVMEKLLEEEY